MKCYNLKILNLTELYVEDLQEYSEFKARNAFGENTSCLQIYLSNKIANKQLNIVVYCLKKKHLYLKTPIEI